MNGGLGLGMSLGKENQQAAVIMAGGGATESLLQLLSANVSADARYLFSVSRVINDNYNGALIRVRRTSDNTEQDINALNGELDTASLLTFTGTTGTDNGRITTIYNQTDFVGLPNLVQNASSSQPYIVDAGALILSTNGKALGRVKGANDMLLFTPIISGNNSALAVNLAVTNAANEQQIFTQASNSGDFKSAAVAAQGMSNLAHLRNRNAALANIYNEIAMSNTNLNSYAFNIKNAGATGGDEIYLNAAAGNDSVTNARGSTANNNFYLFSNIGTYYLTGTFAEVIGIFNYNFSAGDISTISTNQNNFFG